MSIEIDLAADFYAAGNVEDWAFFSREAVGSLIGGSEGYEDADVDEVVEELQRLFKSDTSTDAQVFDSDHEARSAEEAHREWLESRSLAAVIQECVGGSQSAVARQLGESHQAWGVYVRGDRAPTTTKIEAWAKALQLELRLTSEGWQAIPR